MRSWRFATLRRSCLAQESRGNGSVLEFVQIVATVEPFMAAGLAAERDGDDAKRRFNTDGGACARLALRAAGGVAKGSSQHHRYRPLTVGRNGTIDKRENASMDGVVWRDAV
jgi:hypothetical protein